MDSGLVVLVTLQRRRMKKKRTKEAILQTERTEHKVAALNAAVSLYYVMYQVYIHHSKGVSSGGIKFYD